MPLIKKKRIWWEPVAGVKEYVVYVSLEDEPINTAAFGWAQTTGLVSKVVSGKTDLIIPDEWPEFPSQAGTYHLAVTACNDAGNQSDPLLLSGLFNFIAPLTPAKGGVEAVAPVYPTSWVGPKSHTQSQALPPNSQSSSFDQERENLTLIQRGLLELDNHQDLGDAYLGQNVHSMDIHLRNGESQRKA